MASNSGTKRRILASVHLPLDAKYGCEMEDRPYLPAKTAWAFEELLGPYGIPEGTFRQLSMKFCSLSSIKRSSHENKAFSVAIFSPGLGDSRLIHAARARSLASLGYVVATVDHTYEANVVEFPDGTVIYGLSFDENGPAVIAKLLEVCSSAKVWTRRSTNTPRSEPQTSRFSSTSSAVPPYPTLSSPISLAKWTPTKSWSTATL